MKGASHISSYFESDGLVARMLTKSIDTSHVMEATRSRLIMTLFSLISRGADLVAEYNESHPDFPMKDTQVQTFMQKWLLFSILWGFGGSMHLDKRLAFAVDLAQATTIPLPADCGSGRRSNDGEEPVTLLDFEVRVDTGEWHNWNERVPQVEIESHKVMQTDVVINTVDTVRHTEVLRAWLGEHRPVILCGPPGSGKTMSLTSVLKSMPDFILASLNFSSATSPELVLKTFEQYCEYKSTRNGLVLAPQEPGKWLVVFCDEINLPANDAYGTQRVNMFIRQIVESRGFWRASDHRWISVDRIQFVGACNPPTDPGRVPLSLRVLRHTPLLMVDYPATPSLYQIYGTFNRALLKLQPAIRGHGDALTRAMVKFYSANKERFFAEQHPHYVYSPRELTRWMRALYEGIKSLDSVTLEQFVRLFIHEGLRLFHDRLVTAEEREWCSSTLDSVASAQFPSADPTCMARPIYFSNWLSQLYTSVEQAELRKHVQARLKVFYEEELDVPLVVFDDVLEHVLRIDRVLRQPLGHLLLVGESGAGKTVLSRFVSWMNGISVFQIKLTRRYSLEDFDADLREVLTRAGCEGEKICFIFDESNVVSSSFLERMNASAC